jgi:hypothetical protein
MRFLESILTSYEAKKFGGYIQVPPEVAEEARAFTAEMDVLRNEMAAIFNPFASDEVKAAAARSQAARKAAIEERRAALRVKNEALMARLRGVCCPAALVVVELHAPDEEGDCGGCDVAGYEAEQPGWPCSTVDVIAKHYGIDPRDLL